MRDVLVRLAAMCLRRSQSLAALITLLCLVATPTLAGVTPMAAAGWDHTVALKSDGTVVTVGNDSSGQLGLGRLVQSNQPLRVFGVGTVRSIAAGASHALALREDGTVWAWGKNYNGQLGDGTLTDSGTPVQAKGLSEVSAIAAGYYHSLAVRIDGTVWEWGGQFWVGSSITPTQVPDIVGVTTIGAGSAHSVALKQDGTVWAWGNNSSGQLGDGTTIDSKVPVQATGLTGVTSIAVNNDFSLALKQDGTVWAWGNNEFGVLGEGTNTNRNLPTQVQELSEVSAIFATSRTSFALKRDGTVWVWGNNAYASSNRNSPVQVNELNQIASISGGWNYSVALKQDGTVWAWGANEAGQLGNGTNDVAFPPTQVAGLPGANVTMIAAMYASTYALMQDGSVWAWGLNDFGQLGDLGSVGRGVYAQVPGLTEVISVSAGYKRTHALKQDGTVWAWGENQFRDLGDGTNTNRSTPVQVSGLTDITAIAEGAALKQDGTVFAWEGLSSHPTPMLLSGLTGVTAVAEGLALKQDGTVWTWETSTNTATQVPGLVEVIAIAARRYGQAAAGHYLAVKQDGTVWAWGNNALGQLGDGTSTTRSTPVQVLGLTGVTSIATGLYSTRALKQDGTVWAWGYGPLCDGTNNSYLTPIQVTGLTGVASIAAGGPFVDTVALKADGSVWVCGYNAQGQLGDGTLATRLSPVLAVNETADGFLHLKPGTDFEVPPAVGVPFFVVASGAITETRASVSTTTKFNSADLGRTGTVFVTAMVPPGSLAAAQSSMSAAGAYAADAGRAKRALSSAATAADAFVLIQLGASGWQSVVNGELMAYATGVLGDQLAAQTILDNADTTNLKGAQFCLGYGSSADQMIAAGTMRVVATVPDPNATGAAPPSCILASPTTTPTTTTSTTSTTVAPTTTTTTTTATTVASTTTTTQAGALVLDFAQGWNLVGNGSDAPINVTTTFSDTNSFTTAWKWVASQSAWAFHAPALAAQGGTVLADYVAAKGYQSLTTINGGEGFWVNAKQATSINLTGGNAISVATLGPTLVKGWNLAALGETATPKQFCDAQSAVVTTLWAWNATNAAWYFYAPSLDAQGGSSLSNYVSSKGYLDFAAKNKTLGPGVGFWVNKQ